MNYIWTQLTLRHNYVPQWMYVGEKKKKGLSKQKQSHTCMDARVSWLIHKVVLFHWIQECTIMMKCCRYCSWVLKEMKKWWCFFLYYISIMKWKTEKLNECSGLLQREESCLLEHHCLGRPGNHLSMTEFSVHIIHFLISREEVNWGELDVVHNRGIVSLYLSVLPPYSSSAYDIMYLLWPLDLYNLMILFTVMFVYIWFWRLYTWVLFRYNLKLQLT